MAKDLNRHFFKNRKKVFHESLICIYKMIPFAYSFLKDFIYLFLERGEGRERERNIDVREKHQLPPVCAFTWDLTRNSGMSLTGNGISNLVLCETTSNRVSYLAWAVSCLVTLVVGMY